MIALTWLFSIPERSACAGPPEVTESFRFSGVAIRGIALKRFAGLDGQCVCFRMKLSPSRRESATGRAG
ncbi:MAG: hypothetical protein ABI318_11780 [Chthoniobacteraceae bacterium]